MRKVRSCLNLFPITVQHDIYVDQRSADNCLPTCQMSTCWISDKILAVMSRKREWHWLSERERERETEGKNTLEKFTERYHKWQRQFSGKKLLHHNFNPKKNWKESPEGAKPCHLEKWQWKRSLNFSTHTQMLWHTHIYRWTQTHTIKLNIKSILFLYTQFCSCTKLLCHFYRDAAISSNLFLNTITL